MTPALRRRLLAGVAVPLLGIAGALVVGTPAYAASPTATVVKVSEWGSGFEARGTVTNGGTTPLGGWTVAFDLPAGTGISSHWDARMTQSGTRYTFVNPTWAGPIPPGGTASFGFSGSGSGSPSNCTLNGAPCAGGTNPTPGAPGTLRER